MKVFKPDSNGDWPEIELIPNVFSKEHTSSTKVKFSTGNDAVIVFKDKPFNMYGAFYSAPSRKVVEWGMVSTSKIPYGYIKTEDGKVMRGYVVIVFCNTYGQCAVVPQRVFTSEETNLLWNKKKEDFYPWKITDKYLTDKSGNMYFNCIEHSMYYRTVKAEELGIL